MVIFTGSQGIGRTFVALDVAMRVALGRSILADRCRIHGAYRVVYAYGEQFTGSTSRMDALCNHQDEHR